MKEPNTIYSYNLRLPYKCVIYLLQLSTSLQHPVRNHE